jgi:hypothetical protein
MLMMLGPRDKIAGSIIEQAMGPKSDATKKEFSDTCKMAAMELIKALEAKDPNAVIQAFIALSMEADQYEDESEEM